MIDGILVYDASDYTCDQYLPAKPMTNADRIRQMTDEELAKMLDIYDVEEVCEYCGYHGDFACHNRCYAGILAWLKQEVREDAEMVEND